MDIQQNELLREELVFFDIKAENRVELLRKLASLLYENGYVKESYIDAVIERESKYPTGLNTMGVNVAIPHTDSIHVNKTGILIANLNKPVKFKEMGPNDSEVSAELVFMLAIKNPKDQPKTLGKLMGIFSDGDKLKTIKQATKSEEVMDILLKQFA